MLANERVQKYHQKYSTLVLYRTFFFLKRIVFRLIEDFLYSISFSRYSSYIIMEVKVFSRGLLRKNTHLISHN